MPREVLRSGRFAQALTVKGAGTIRTVALEDLQPKQLLTVHYVPLNIMDEYLQYRYSLLQYYYTKQHNASVLIYAPHEEILGVVERFTGLPALSYLSYSLTTQVKDEARRRGLPMFGPLMQWNHTSGVEFLFMGARIEPPATMAGDPVANCAGRTWTRQYVLHAGVQAGYHMLRLPPLKWYDFVIKMDTDMEFVKEMEDLGARLATSAQVQVLHTALLPSSSADDSCQREVGSQLEVYTRRQPHTRAGNVDHVPWWCREPIGYIFWTNFVGFRTSFLLAPATQALSAFYYNEAWKVYFRSRAQEQGVYIALVCH